jgi:hypothetical protein
MDLALREQKPLFSCCCRPSLRHGMGKRRTRTPMANEREASGRVRYKTPGRPVGGKVKGVGLRFGTVLNRPALRGQRSSTRTRTIFSEGDEWRGRRGAVGFELGFELRLDPNATVRHSDRPYRFDKRGNSQWSAWHSGRGSLSENLCVGHNLR